MDYSILLGIEQVRINNYHDIQNESPNSLKSGDSSKDSSGLDIQKNELFIVSVADSSTTLLSLTIFRNLISSNEVRIFTKQKS